DTVLAIADEVEPLKLHVLAMRAYARLLAIDASVSVSERIAGFDRAMQVARRVDEKKLLLAKLAELKNVETLPAFERYLDDAELAPDAASAMLTVAEAIVERDWLTSRGVIDKVRATVELDAIHERADRLAEQVSEREDFITTWLVAGPYELPDKNGFELHDVAFPPEDASATDVEWMPQPVIDDVDRYWFVDLNTPRPASNCCKYLFTRVYSPAEQPATLELGSDDGIKVWLNGEVVHSNNVPRGCAAGQDVVKATLREGWNDLLLKITNGGGGFGASARIRTTDGHHVDGIKFSTER
ncbi:MAG: hypothetical protein JXO22_15950, partial [Phycisphaerae bacterium]|nr:hypothetical protein [Phycisphaerae bacterium]